MFTLRMFLRSKSKEIKLKLTWETVNVLVV